MVADQADSTTPLMLMVVVEPVVPLLDVEFNLLLDHIVYWLVQAVGGEIIRQGVKVKWVIIPKYLVQDPVV